ncbi:GSCFA domain-containing protein [soil metagenome]
MNFHLNFPISSFPQKINYSHSSLFIGSCFAENVGDLMKHYKFNTLINPHGVLYNPASIANALRRYLKIDFVTDNELFFANDCWNSWEHHSRFSNPDKQKCLLEINKNISDAHVALKTSDWLFITFGSSFVYKRNFFIVGNCHKQAQKEFTKELLTTAEISAEYKVLIADLKKLNPNLKIVFTISPVRYIREGAVENNLSKARLIDAVHQLTSKDVFYFPAYELVIDDLRDYRFYKEDLVHPNEQAIEYVFDKLQKAMFDKSTITLFEKIKEIVTAKEHRPFNEDTQAHQKFKATCLERCVSLQKEFPFLDMKEELNYFKK